MIEVVLCAALAFGGYWLLAAARKLPPAQTARELRRATARKTPLSQQLMRHLQPLIGLVAKGIRLAPYRRQQLVGQLSRAGLQETPETYIARAVLLAGLTLFGGMALCFAAARALLPLAALLAGLVFVNQYRRIRDILKEKERLVERELPQFVRGIVHGMRTQRDITKLFESYVLLAKGGLRYDLEVLVTDLHAGSFEAGMTAFDARLGNAYISRLCKALIAQERGEDQSAALTYLMGDMALLSKETMQRELAKRPGRVRAVVIPLVALAVITLFYVIGSNLFSSLGGLV